MTKQNHSSNVFRWGIIGTGHFAFDIAGFVTKSNRHQFVACYNRTKTKAEKFASVYGGKVYDTVEALLKDPNVDGIYIATTADQHAHYAKLAIEAKKAVLVEKPFGVNAEQTRQIYQLAHDRGVYLSEAMWTWYNDIAITVKTWIKEKRIGEITKVKITFGMPIVNFQPHSRLTDVNRCGGALMDIGVYPLHYIYELFGEPTSIDTDGYTDQGVDYHSKTRLHYPGFSVIMRVAMDRYLGERLVVVGKEGKIVVPFFHMAATAILKSKGTRLVIKNPAGKMGQLYVPQFDRVAEEIRQGKIQSDYVTPASTIATMGFIDQCRKSLKVYYRNEEKEY